ncbi:MAG: PKD domain-containing protein, partial [Bacteroidales bacterium]|nr:PKD domain-containing protein [Bacteroidales bacterium]
MSRNNSSMEYRLDPTVKWVMTTICIAAVVFFIFQLTNYQACPEVDFEVAEGKLMTGDLIEFTCRNKNVTSYHWDFGDGGMNEGESSPAHIYESAGTYTVKLVLNGNCVKEREIEIESPPVIVKNEVIMPDFSIPSQAYVGSQVHMRCLNTNAKQYAWNFGESGGINSNRKNPVHTYKAT